MKFQTYLLLNSQICFRKTKCTIMIPIARMPSTTIVKSLSLGKGFRPYGRAGQSHGYKYIYLLTSLQKIVELQCKLQLVIKHLKNQVHVFSEAKYFQMKIYFKSNLTGHRKHMSNRNKMKRSIHVFLIDCFVFLMFLIKQSFKVTTYDKLYEIIYKLNQTLPLLFLCVCAWGEGGYNV